MRVARFVQMIGLVVFLLVGLACEQESIPPNQTKTVVKRIEPQAAQQESTEPIKPEYTEVTRGAPTMVLGKAEEEGRSFETPPRQAEDYVYDPVGRKDPFTPFFIKTQTTGEAGECEGVPPGPLTDKEVSQFTLVGVVKRSGDNVAMVQDPEGKGYTIRVGAYLGIRCGKVTSISPEGVIVEEPYTDVLGKRKLREISLKLRTSE